MSEFLLNPKNYKTYFSWDKYAELDKAQRKELIKFSVDQISKEKGLKSVDVRYFTDDPGSRGSCGQKFDDRDRFVGHTLNINDDVLTVSKNDVTPDYYAPYKLYNTMNHELEHASQFELASNRHIKNSNPVALEQRLNDQHYYNASGDKKVIWQGQSGRAHRFDDGIDYQMYRAQACEADARAAGYFAVESLRNEIPNDAHLDSYLKTQKAREINNNRVMMSKLGMHSREEMANEELQYISTRKLKEPDRQRVLEYARQKDFETAKEVLNADSRGLASEEELKNRFDNNQGYSNFYKSPHYNQNKVNESNHGYYIYAKHKWQDEENDTELHEDASDIEKTESGVKESVSFREKMKGAWGKVSDYFNSFADSAGYDPDVQEAAAILGKGTYKAFEYSAGVSDLTGSVSESVAQFSKAAAPFVIGGSKRMMENAHRQYELPSQKYMRERPLRTADGTPLSIEEGRQRAFVSAKMHSDEIVNSPMPLEKQNTVQVDDSRIGIEDSESLVSENGDAAFFEGVDKQSSQISMEADQEFFEEQDSYAPLDDGEDQSFFDKIDQKSFELGQKLDEKIEGAMQTAARITNGQKK